MNKKIFITIPAYEDANLINTIKSCIDNSAYPDNLNFAIALQYSEEPDLSDYSDFIVGIDRYDPMNRPGLQKVRKELTRYRTDEQYYLQIDAHMFFADNWDIDLINDYTELQTQKSKKEVVLSKQCSEATGNINGLVEITKWRLERSFGTGGVQYGTDINHTVIGSLLGDVEEFDDCEKFVLTHYYSGHFAFMDATWISSVGFVDNVEIVGEEQYTAFRTFMRGWDIYSNPKYNYLGHLRGDNSNGHWGRTWMTGQWENPSAVDTLEAVLEMDRAFVLNDGEMRCTSPKRPVYDFWQAIGLSSSFAELVSLVKI